MPKISIVIPFYNSEKYLYNCIKSILNQTCKDIEIICVDDGSSDSSKDIIYSFQDKRIRYFYTENKGVSYARNIGIKQVKGKYLLFVDSDDWIEPNTCDCLLSAMEKNNPDILFFRYRYYKEGEYRIIDYSDSKECRKFKTKPLPFANISNSVLLLNYVIWNKFYNVNYLKENKIMFNECSNFSEDMLFSIYLFSKNPEIMMIDEVLYNYRITENSSSNLSYKEMFDSLFKIYNYSIAQDYYKNQFKVFVDNIFLKMCIYIYNRFIYIKDNQDIILQVEKAINLIKSQKNINVYNSFRYRKLVYIVIYNKMLKILKHKLCIF